MTQADLVNELSSDDAATPVATVRRETAALAKAMFADLGGDFEAATGLWAQAVAGCAERSPNRKRPGFCFYQRHVAAAKSYARETARSLVRKPAVQDYDAEAWAETWGDGGYLRAKNTYPTCEIDRRIMGKAEFENYADRGQPVLMRTSDHVPGAWAAREAWTLAKVNKSDVGVDVIVDTRELVQKLSGKTIASERHGRLGAYVQSFHDTAKLQQGPGFIFARNPESLPDMIRAFGGHSTLFGAFGEAADEKEFVDIVRFGWSREQKEGHAIFSLGPGRNEGAYFHAHTNAYFQLTYGKCDPMVSVIIT